MAAARIIFPHQLFKNNPLFTQPGVIYLVEEFLFFRQYRFHKQKIAYHRATMKYYEHTLFEKGLAVKYIQTTEKESDIRELIPYLYKVGIDSIIIIDPVDDWLMKRINKNCRTFNIDIKVLDSPMFLNTPQNLRWFFQPSKTNLFQTEFYIQERIKKNILINQEGGPVGGHWSFDEANRKRWPKSKPVTYFEFPRPDEFVVAAREYTEQHFSGNIGDLNNLINYPNTHDAAMQWLRQFLQNRLAEFGQYEDAIVHKNMLLNHSLLTPMLNTGLLTASEIVEGALEYSNAHAIPINSTEGFIRQIIGWREFIRGVYITKGSEERTKNYWGFTRKMPASFYDGSTGIFPVDATIKKVLRSGYCHHIERLMVLGNFMLLCEFDPDEVYRWFMQMFIDAYDWVMVPNVYGMSQFADGGMMSTKPYISGSNYLMKMGDYPKGNWQEIWDALFWRFLDKQRAFFQNNPRLNILLKTFDNWDESRKDSMRAVANAYFDSL